MRRHLACVVVLGIVFNGARGQTYLSFPLPSGFPASWDAEVFTDGEALALKAAGVIRVLTGFGALAAVSVQTIGFGAATPAGPWQRLSDSRALYASTGGELVLVTGLPAAPVVIPTGVSGSAPGWIVANATTAVQPDPGLGTFRVLRHSAAGANHVNVLSPFAISGDPYRPGRIDDGIVAAMGPGADAVPGTGDDLFLLLRGLDGFPGGVHVTAASVPSGYLPLGSGVSTTGVLFFWEALQPQGVPTTLVRNLTGTPFGLTYVVMPPSYIGSFMFSSHGAVPGVGDTVLPWIWDDTAIGNVYGIIQQVSTLPFVAGGLTNTDTVGVQVADNEVVAFSPLGGSGPQPLSLHRFLPTGTVSQNRTMAGDPGRFVKPNPGSLAFPTQAIGGSGLIQLITDLFGSSGSAILPLAGITDGRDPIVVGPGRVAVFVSAAPGGPCSEVGVVAIPANCRVANAMMYGQSLLSLGVLPAVPVPGAFLRFDVLTLANWAGGTAWLGVATRLAAPIDINPGGNFAVFLHLDISALAALQPIPLSSGWGQWTIPGTGIPPPPAILGLPIYVQAFAPGFTGWLASDVRLLTIG